MLTCHKLTYTFTILEVTTQELYRIIDLIFTKIVMLSLIHPLEGLSCIACNIHARSNYQKILSVGIGLVEKRKVHTVYYLYMGVVLDLDAVHILLWLLVRREFND